MNINKPLLSQIPELRTLWKEAFGDTDEFLDIFFKKAFHPDRCRCITVDKHVVAVLYWFDCIYEDKPIAYIYAVATAKSHRGQGLCQKLMADTHLHLAKHGYEGAILVPGNKELFDFYKKIGYQTSCYLRKFQCDAASEDLPLYSIDKEEYARLRKFLLPPGSVIQEHKNLDFLETQAKFYMGHGFILTAYGEKDVLHGIELLGDISAAPAIIHTLGYKKGFFRTVGNQIPFAMYYPLEGSTLLPPSYFGFAFD